MSCLCRFSQYRIPKRKFVDVTKVWLVGWLVGCFWFNSPLRQYFNLYRAVSPREGERKRKDRRQKRMSKQPPPAPTASALSPCPTIIQTSRTPRHWKFTQHHRTTRPTPLKRVYIRKCQMIIFARTFKNSHGYKKEIRSEDIVMHYEGRPCNYFFQLLRIYCLAEKIKKEEVFVQTFWQEHI